MSRPPTDVICVTGSLYLVGELRPWLTAGQPASGEGRGTC